MNFSIDFFNTIKRISYNKIASIIFDLQGSNNQDINYDYIVTTDINNIVGFLTPKRVNELKDSSVYYTVNDIRNLTHSSKNDKIFIKIGYDRTTNEYWYPHTGDRGLILNECVSNETGREYVLFQCANTNRLSVINKVAIVPADFDFFALSKNKIKIGRLVNNILNDLNIDVTPKEIEEFVNLYKSSYDLSNNKDLQFRLVEGDEISHWYHINNYDCDRKGSLASSCMAIKEADYFDLYTQNKNCKMLVLLSDSGTLKDNGYESDKISGRALVWKGLISDMDGNSKEITLMDRVYSNNDSDVQLFVEYAKKMGWYYKDEQTRYSDTPITNGDEVHHFYDSKTDTFTSEFLITLDNYILDKYPYVDTFCYLKDNCLSNVLNLGNERNDYKNRCFRSTSGYFELHR
jgi:hypothetical protein